MNNKHWIVTNNLTVENTQIFLEHLGENLYLLDPVNDIDVVITNDNPVDDSSD